MPEKEMEKFERERKELNKLLMKRANLNMNRFMNVDSQAYKRGALSAKTKELLGLVSSLVLRCECREDEVTTEELVEALGVGLVVGGSVTIPHIRRVLKYWDELQGTGNEI
jgi:alkylhydroperoxidase/carboxymuconolactone decarboxylase family protein YurZ